MFSEEYNGGLIVFCESSNKWEAVIGNERSTHDTPDLCRKKIDKVMKADFKRFDALCITGWDCDQVSRVTVTSIDGDEVWVVTDGSRSKVKFKNLRTLDEESEVLFNEIVIKNKQRHDTVERIIKEEVDYRVERIAKLKHLF